MLENLSSLPANPVATVTALGTLVATLSEPVNHAGLDVLRNAVLLLANGASWSGAARLVILLNIFRDDILFAKHSGVMSATAVADLDLSRKTFLQLALGQLPVEAIVCQL